jgi:hypothetical protein
MYLLCLQGCVSEGTENKGNKQRNMQGASRDSHILESDDHSNGEMEFPPGLISPQSQILLALLMITSAEILGRIGLPKLPLEDCLFPNADEVAGTAERSARRRAPTGGPTASVINLKGYVNRIIGIILHVGTRRLKRIQRGRK